LSGLRLRLATTALLAAGCAPALSSFTPAHVAPKKHVQAEVGFDVSVPTGTITGVVDQGATLGNAARDRELTEDEQRRLFQAGAALGLNPPSLVSHVGVGYTLLDHFEVNGRLTSGAWRLGARYQLLQQALQQLDGTLSLGGGHYSYEFPLSDQIPFIKLEDFRAGRSTWRSWPADTVIGTGFGAARVCCSRSTAPSWCSSSHPSPASRPKRRFWHRWMEQAPTWAASSAPRAATSTCFSASS